MASDNTVVHLLAGGAGGTVGAVLTCPLEVVKTRLQSSIATFNQPIYVSKVAYTPSHQSIASSANFTTYASTSSTGTQTVTRTMAGQSHLGSQYCPSHATASSTGAGNVSSPAVRATNVNAQTRNTSVGLYRCLKHIIQTEGAAALFKGLGPNLVGVAPSRAIYFCSYAQAKMFFNSVTVPETPLVHICSAAVAGFAASTTTNPIWFIKTRLQLDQKRSNSLTVRHCVRDIYQSHGLRGFYKGITASYYGISETVIHFVIYEAIKAKLREMKGQLIDEEERNAIDFVEFMAAGATSKTIATCVAYPHEVARTRLREEGNKYRGFWQTLGLVGREEGLRGLYRGLTTQLVRQIPNTAIMMSTYEAVVYLCQRQLAS